MKSFKRMAFLISLGFMSFVNLAAQTDNIKCTYLATRVIPESVKQMEDIHIRELVIAKMQKERKTFAILFSDNKYLCFESNAESSDDIQTVGAANNIYIDLNADSIIAQKNILDKDFLIKDKYKTYEWTLTEEKKNINGKECIKAIPQGNQNVTAWFTTEIPLSFGPMGYLGLPGLIVQLDTPTQSFLLQEIINLKEQPVIKAPSKGQIVTQDEFDKLQKEKMKSRGVESGKVKVIRL